jgi:hypothetical protein
MAKEALTWFEVERDLWLERASVSDIGPEGSISLFQEFRGG